MNRIYLLLPLFLCVACATVSNSELQRAKATPVTREAFAANPFGFELDAANLDRYYGKSLRRRHYLTDDRKTEIFRYTKGPTDLLFRKHYGEPVVAEEGTIMHDKIALANGIHTGMSRKEFFWHFSDWLYDSADMLTIASSATGCTFHFRFKGDKLVSIRFVNRTQKLERLREESILSL